MNGQRSSEHADSKLWEGSQGSTRLATPLILALTAAALLAACGGGGGSATSPAPAPTPAPPPPDQSLQTQVPALTYAADAPERLFFEYANKQRGQCGFGLLAQNALLDRSVKNHLLYVNARYATLDGALDYLKTPHVEKPELSGFTGASVADRQRAAGYTPAGTSEILQPGWVGSDTNRMVIGQAGLAAGAVRTLSGTVYHLQAMVGEYRDAGTATVSEVIKQNPNGSLDLTSLVGMDFGYTQYPQRTQELASYPCSGATDVQNSFGAESPDPLAGSGVPYPAGQPLYWRAPAAAKAIAIRLLSVTPQNAAQGTASFSVAAGTIYVLTNTNDPQKRVSATEVFAIPKQPLAASTQYRVTGELDIDGKTQAVDYSFTTGLGAEATMRDAKYRVRVP